MKKSEKIIIIVILFLLLGTFIIGHQFTTALLISIFILGVCYVFGGYYFFNDENNKYKLNILSGIILGFPLGIFVFVLDLPISKTIKFFVSLNIIFLFVLVGIWIYKKRHFNKNLKYVLFRSISIAIFTSFFAFSSTYSKTYRNLLLRMLAPDSPLSNNLLMFEKVEECEGFMDLKKYDLAIVKAKEAILYGKKWRNYDTLYYQDFSGLYEYLSDIYKDKANVFFNKKDFKNALSNYIKVDSVLTDKEHKPMYVKTIGSKIYWNHYKLLLTYDKLLDYDNYDSELDYLVANYLKVKDTFDINYHYILESASSNYYKRSQYKEAIECNKYSLIILNQDSLNNINSFKSTYIRLVRNYTVTDSTELARKYLGKYEEITSNNDCQYLLYKIGVLQKENVKEALEVAKKTCKCMKLKFENKPLNLFITQILLLKLELENSNYKNFEKQIKITQNLISKIDNKINNQSFIDELLGSYNFMKGNYKDSKKYYLKALNSSVFKELQKKSIELKIAQIDNELDIDYDRNSLNLETIKFLSKYETISPSTTIFHNDLGNLNTVFDRKLSDSIFKVTIECHKKYGINKSPRIGIAYNGLAINQFNRKAYKKADSLYIIAIKNLNDFYGKQQNINQLICYLNIVELKLNQKKYDEALDFFNKARLTKINCFDEEVTLYDAYILNLEGDIIKLGGENKSLANEKYKQAIVIAKKYFDDNHRFIKKLKSKCNYN